MNIYIILYRRYIYSKILLLLFIYLHTTITNSSSNTNTNTNTIITYIAYSSAAVGLIKAGNDPSMLSILCEIDTRCHI
jgi:hypothetical protein